jgi:hypothetical protein
LRQAKAHYFEVGRVVWSVRSGAGRLEMRLDEDTCELGGIEGALQASPGSDVDRISRRQVPREVWGGIFLRPTENGISCVIDWDEINPLIVWTDLQLPKKAVVAKHARFSTQLRHRYDFAEEDGDGEEERRGEAESNLKADALLQWRSAHLELCLLFGHTTQLGHLGGMPLLSLTSAWFNLS